MKKICLHLGNGTIYLKNWINIDLKVANHFLAKDCPDLARANQTTLNNYYKDKATKADFVKGTYHKRPVVCDLFADVRELPFKKETVDEILAVQLFEHFRKHEAENLLKYWYGLLKKGGFIEIHVPDVEGIYEEYRVDGDVDWMMRQLYGSQKHKFSFHKYGYTEVSLSQLLMRMGFKELEFLEPINQYPALRIRGQK